MRSHLRAALMALPLAMGPGHEAAAKIKLIPEFDADMRLTRPIENVEEFLAKLSVGVYEDPRLVNPQRLREIIEKLDLRTPLGRKVTDLVIHPGTGAFVGIDSGSIQLAGTLPDGSIVISTRGPDGRFARTTRNGLVWARPNGAPVCFDLVDVAQSDVKMSFTLLLDRSGSMVKVMDQVIATTRHFVSLLPGNAQCSVVSFADDWVNHTPGGSQECGAVQIVGAINAKGSTNIHRPLLASYRRYTSPVYDGWQKAVIIITDGIARTSAEAKAQLISEKGDVGTFVFWLGNRDEKYLSDIADYFIARQGDVGAYLSEVYGALGEAYGKQQVLKPRACPAAVKP